MFKNNEITARDILYVFKCLGKGVIKELVNTIEIIIDSSNTPASFNVKKVYNADLVKDYLHYSDTYKLEDILNINYITVGELMDTDTSYLSSYDRNFVESIKYKLIHMEA